MRHLWHPEWRTTYCGLPALGTKITTTTVLVSCPRCFENHALATSILDSNPAQFGEA